MRNAHGMRVDSACLARELSVDLDRLVDERLQPMPAVNVGWSSIGGWEPMAEAKPRRARRSAGRRAIAAASPEREGRRLGVLPELLGYRLRQAQIAVFLDFCAGMEALGVTPGRFGVLQVVAANPGLSQSELGGILGIDRSTVVAVIDRLEAGDLVRRMPAPKDRRSHALVLGRRGEALLPELEARVRAHEERIARNLSEAERQTLLDLLSRLARDRPA